MTSMPRDEFLVERRSLGLSVLCGFVLAVVGIAIGVGTGSQIILFDGFYTFLGIGLSWMAMRVSFLVASGPTSRYPFGREALTPLIIGVEGVALLATCSYAGFKAVLTIVHGAVDCRPAGASRTRSSLWCCRLACGGGSDRPRELRSWCAPRQRSGSRAACSAWACSSRSSSRA